MSYPAGQSHERSFRRSNAGETGSALFRRLAGPACAVLCLVAALCLVPASPAHAGGAGINAGDCPPPGPAGCSDPVILPLGNVFERMIDYRSGGFNRMVVTRYLNNEAGAPGGSFCNWSWTYDRRLGISNSEVDVYRPDGKVIYFFPNGQGGWSGISDLSMTLTQGASTWTLTDWDDNVETYYANYNGYTGLLASITARNGYTQTMQYAANNLGDELLSSVVDSYGRTLTINHNGYTCISSITAPDGLVLNYTYDNIGNYLTQVSYPTSPATIQSYVYEDTNFPRALTGIIDENGNRFASWAYDDTYPYPRAISSQLAGGANLTRFTYNSDGSITTTNALGLQQVYKFGSFQASIDTSFPQYLDICTEVDRLATATTAAATSTNRFDSNGYVARLADWNGNVTTFTNDARGNQLSRTLASGTTQAETVTTTWLSNFHLPTQITEPKRVTSFTYDANGNMLSKTITTSQGPTPSGGSPFGVSKTLTTRGTWLYGNTSVGRFSSSPPQSTTSTWTYTYSNSLMTSVTDPDGNTTTYTYDASGNLVSITNALGQAILLPVYDSNGRALTIVDANGLVTTLTYNARGQVNSKTEGQWLTTYTYDAVGDLIKITRPDGAFLAFTYDQAHRLVGVADAFGNFAAYTLDAAGNSTKVQVFDASNALIRTRSFAYDALSRMLRQIGAAGQTTSYFYDNDGNPLQVTDPLSNVTSGAYDALSRLVEITDANGGITSLGYDAENRLTGVTDPRGLSTSYAYDVLNDVTSLVSPDTGTTARTYDAAGNLVSATDARGDTTTYTYDGLNRLTKAALADSTSITYQYDHGTNGIGHLTAMTDAGGTTAWTYDIHGHVTSKQQTSGGVTLTTSHSYNATTGQLTGTTYPSGAAISYSYDFDGRVSAMSYQPSGGSMSSLLSQVAYQPFGPAASWTQGSGASYSRTFDQDGRITGIALPTSTTPTGVAPASLLRASARPSATPVSDTIALTYDLDSRITGMTETGLPPKSFAYDALGRITGYTNVATTQSYAYDTNGNRTGLTSATASSSIALTYHYDSASNRLLSVGGSHAESFSYDANGNMLTHNSPSGDYTYTYNARNRRSQAYVGAIATTDTINGLGQRTVQTEGGGTEFFVYDETGRLIGSYNGQGGLIEETVWLGDLPVAMLSPNGPYYIAPDHLGAPHQIADGRGHIGWLWDHDPFGNGLPLGTFSDNLRFPGQFYDQNAKLHYNYFRDYDPGTGRYIESDPTGLRGGINTYAYAESSAVGASDRLGLQGNTLPPVLPPNNTGGWGAWQPNAPRPPQTNPSDQMAAGLCATKTQAAP